MNADDLKSLFANTETEGKQNIDKNNSESDDIIASPWQEMKDRFPAKRVIRPVRVSAIVGGTVDPRIVSYSLYNSFNYAMFMAKDHETTKLSLGVTSPNINEGKTTTVCNLATALAMGSGKRTVIVDINLYKPSIHEIFGIPCGPGLAEALMGEEICVTPTKIENLFALPAGNARILVSNKLPAFREVLAALYNEFDFVIVDLPPASSRGFPTLIANQLSGLIVVVRSRVTKRREIARLFRKLPEKSILGFVMNGVNENDL